MSRIWKKKGVWIFLACVVLFFGGPSYLGWKVSQSAQPAKSEQGFEVQGIHTVRIEKDDSSTAMYRQLSIRIVEPATHVAASFDSSVYVLESRVEGDVLVVTFKVPDDVPGQRRRHRRGQSDEEILIPSSIQNLEFVNAGSLNISTETPVALPVLNTRIADCHSTVNFENMEVEKMVVTQLCRSSAGKESYPLDGRIQLNHVNIQSLEIASAGGYISFENLVKTGTLQLNLGNAVKVSADAAVLRTARFGDAPQ